MKTLAQLMALIIQIKNAPMTPAPTGCTQVESPAPITVAYTPKIHRGSGR